MVNPVVNELGSKLWRDANGNLHRADGPALEHANGDRSWWQYGLRHRTGGPAVEFATGDKWWYQHGKIHRADGPAIEWANGRSTWYSNDNCLSFDKWLNKVDLSGEGKVMMKLKYG